MRSKGLILVGTILVVLLGAAAPAFGYSGVVTAEGCGLSTCHTRPGYTNFASWHTNHQPPNRDLVCESCHPNNHTQSGPPSAPDATYSVTEACNPCHVGMAIAPVHLSAGVLDCLSCHPESGTLTGVVSGGGSPLAGVTVTIDGSTTAQTYAGGQYIVARVPVGSHEVTFESPGYVSHVATGVVVTYGSTTHLDAALFLVPPPDTTAPMTMSDALASYDLTATITLAAADETGGSGVALTEWRIDQGSWTSGTIVTGAAPGTHLLEFRSTDVAGNLEVTRQVWFTVRSKPTVGTPAAPLTASRYRNFTASGTLKPRHTTGTYPVRIYRWKRTSTGGWKSYSYVTARVSNYSTYSRYARSMRLPYAGRWRLRAYAPADKLHVSTWSSRSDYVTVR